MRSLCTPADVNGLARRLVAILHEQISFERFSSSRRNDTPPFLFISLHAVLHVVVSVMQ